MKKFDNFVSALENLKDIYQYDNPGTNVEIAGLVALYEICFEQAWKAMKEILEDNGFSGARTGSPKMIIKTAYSAGMIRDEETWLEALTDRNNVSHSYNKKIALSIIGNTKEKYVEMFEQLKSAIQEEWLS